jgi:hypothetical protein
MGKNGEEFCVEARPTVLLLCLLQENERSLFTLTLRMGYQRCTGEWCRSVSGCQCAMVLKRLRMRGAGGAISSNLMLQHTASPTSASFAVPPEVEVPSFGADASMGGGGRHSRNFWHAFRRRAVVPTVPQAHFAHSTIFWVSQVNAFYRQFSRFLHGGLDFPHSLSVQTRQRSRRQRHNSWCDCDASFEPARSRRVGRATVGNHGAFHQ